MSLSEIEVVKTIFFQMSLADLTLTNPLFFAYNRNIVNLNFDPDFVKVKSASIYDTGANASVGIYQVNCNFIRDQDVLLAISSSPITLSGQYNLDLLHQFVTANQLQFTVTLAEIFQNPSADTMLSFTLEFVKLKK